MNCRTLYTVQLSYVTVKQVEGNNPTITLGNWCRQPDADAESGI